MADTFHKMHGLGNDFMLLDQRDGWQVPPVEKIRAWSDRRTGVGFDQLIFVTEKQGQWHYRFFNADGSEAEQCGNGQRALALYLHRFRGVTGAHVVQGLGGEVGLECRDEDRIEVTLNQQVSSRIVGDGVAVDVGNPHWVLATEDVQSADFSHWEAQAHKLFPEGVNIELVETLAADEIAIRIVERGVGETQACGSGACAAAWVAAQNNDQASIKVHMPGGMLMIHCDEKGGKIRMVGSAKHVYQGVIKG